MALYSRWDPASGLYDYFETAERFGIGDDLPVPEMPVAGPLGVASTEAGRVPKGRLRARGRGVLPKGHIMPLDRRGLVLSGADAGASEGVSPAVAFLAGGALVGLFCWWSRRRS